METQAARKNQPTSFHSATPSEKTHRVDDRLVEVARQLGPLIRKHAEEAERERRLAKPVIEALKAAGMFRLNAPTSLGGFEVDPMTYSRIVEEISRFDSAAGWILQAGNTSDWWAARVPDEGVEEIFAAGPDIITAAAFHPPQQAVEVEGGYRVTGRGPLASSIHDAQWLFLTALVMDGDHPKMTNDMPEVVGVVLRASEAEIIDTWYSLGMRGTDSNDVAVKEVFVPKSRSYALVPDFKPGRYFQGPLYRFPGIGQAVTIAVPTALGVAREAISALRDLAQRKTPFGSSKSLQERSMVQSTLAQAEAILRSARLLYYDTLRAAWERALEGTSSTLEQKADLLLAGTHAMKSATTVVEMMHRLAGTSGIYTRNLLERLFRDAQTLQHHGFVSESRYEAVGQVYLGVPPEFGMVAF